jgi:hypothetical protein
MSIYASLEELDGTMRTYDGSHIYPDTKGHKRPADVSLAVIPPWCIHGSDPEDIEGLYAPWVRLDVATYNPEWKRPMSSAEQTVILSVEALKSLVDRATTALCLTDPDPAHRCDACTDIRHDMEQP